MLISEGGGGKCVAAAAAASRLLAGDFSLAQHAGSDLALRERQLKAGWHGRADT